MKGIPSAREQAHSAKSRPERSVCWLVAPVLAMLGGCSSLGLRGDGVGTLANPPRLHDSSSDAESARSAAQRQIASYYEAMLQAEKEPEAGGKAVGRYLGEGLALVDSYCLRWFQHLEDFERRADAKKKDYNVLSALGTALIGVAKLHPDVTAVYGAANTAYTGWSDNQAQTLAIAPSSRGVKNKVMTVMRDRAEEIRLGRASLDFLDVRRDLERYADLCTYTSAKDLVDVAVAAAEPSVQPSGQFKVVSRATFAPDRATALLRKLWKPNGQAIDAGVEAKLNNWLREQSKPNEPPSVTLFLRGGEFAPLRQRALDEIDFK